MPKFIQEVNINDQFTLPIVSGSDGQVLTATSTTLTEWKTPTSGASGNGILDWTVAQTGLVIHNSNIAGLVEGTGTDNYIPLWDGTNELEDSVIYQSSGEDIGIGTNSPKAKLHVADGTIRTWNPTSGTSAIFESASNNRNFVTLTAANEAEIWFGNATTQAKGRIRYEMANDNMEFWTYATQRMVINNSGNVGIGATSPSELLHIKSAGPARLLIEADTDNLTETDNAQIILKQDGGAVVGNLGFKTNTNGIEITNQYGGSDGILTLGTSNTERMRINYLGNVGIGTTNPKSKLQVTGLPQYLTNANAVTAGLTAGAFYHTAGTLKVVI
jgi:hypothetical protein